MYLDFIDDTFLAQKYIERIQNGVLKTSLVYLNTIHDTVLDWDKEEKYNEFTTKQWKLNLYNAIGKLSISILEDRYYNLDSVEWNDTTWYTKFNIDSWLTKCRRHNIPIVDIMKNYEIDILNKKINEFSTI